jgi:cysteine desulfurase
VFCSGGTEANNIAIFAAARGRQNAHVITTTIEHPAVLQPCRQLESEGVEVTYVPVSGSGVVDPDDIRRALRPDTVLISVMNVNNEIGTEQPVAEIAAIANEAEVAMHCDGVQAAGRIPVGAYRFTYYTASAHKMYAPKGVGALVVHHGTSVEPAFFGGRHEGGWRPGTENVPGAIAFGVSAKSASGRLESEGRRIASLRDVFEKAVIARIPDIRVNCARSPRAQNTSNICFEGIEGEAVVIALDLRGFCVSSGAACSSGAVEPSHVLTAIGLSRKEAKSCVRFSFGASNTMEDTDALVDALEATVARLRRLSTDYAVHA